MPSVPIAFPFRQHALGGRFAAARILMAITAMTAFTVTALWHRGALALIHVVAPVAFNALVVASGTRPKISANDTSCGSASPAVTPSPADTPYAAIQQRRSR